MREISHLENSLEELRKSFDRSFSLAPKMIETRGNQGVIFTLDRENYFIPLKYVQEIIKVPHITIAPGAPPVIMGIMNLRGVLVSVSSIHGIFGLNQEGITPESRIIVTKNLEVTTGVFVDSIQGVVEIKDENIQPAPGTLGKEKAEFIKGEFYEKNKLVIILEMERLINSPQMQVG